MASHSSCRLCFERYDEKVRPRCLTCGHSFCTVCLEGILSGGVLICPKCNEESFGVDATAFPINYDLEESYLSSKTSLVSVEVGDYPNSNSKQMKLLLDNQKSAVLHLINTNETLLQKLKDYDLYLLTRKGKFEEIGQKLRDCLLQNETIFTHMNGERKRIAEMLAEFEELSKGVKEILPSIHIGSRISSILSGIATIDEKVISLEELNDKYHQQFTTNRINTLETILFGTFNNLLSLDRLWNLSETGVLSLELLKRKSDELMKFLEEGYVYATHSNSGENLFAQMSLKNGKVIMHYMKAKKTPNHVLAIQLSDLQEILDDKIEVFLDLSWDDEVKGRVHIELTPKTPLGDHFRVLCTGETGVTYANSSFHSVSNGNQNNETINGGDYQFGNGTGGASVIQGLEKDDVLYSRMYSAGLVFAGEFPATPDRFAQFSIVTSDTNTMTSNSAFGHVQEGLDVVKAAALTTVTNVKIVDCGLVLPL